MSMIIGRKQVILAALVIALGTAIFLNWKFSKADGGFNLASVFNTSSSLGDAAYASNQKGSASATDYFSQARLTREQNRDQVEETLKTVTNNSSATSSEKQQAQSTIQSVATNITTEGNIESLIKAKGFNDCVCFINNGTVNIVVKPKGTTSLSSSDTAQIKDIVISQAKVSADNIKIIVSK